MLLRNLGDTAVAVLRRPIPVFADASRATAQILRPLVLRLDPRQAPGAAAAYIRRHAAGLVTVSAFALLFVVEARTGWLESGVFSSLSRQMRWTVERDPSPTIAFPRGGPFDLQRGYAMIPEFARALEARGYRIDEQSRFSSPLMFLSRLGIAPPGRDKPAAGLVIRDARADTVFDAMHGRARFAEYSDIPPLVTRSLLYIENRELADDAAPRRNPALDWGRLAKASILWAGRHVGLPLRVEGGSTLAVQLEKYRHSGGGRTQSPAEKLRQIAAASLSAYHDGPNTTEHRREVVLDYINTLPLAASPEVGEVSGVAEGLRVWFGRDPEATWQAIRESRDSRSVAAAYKPVLALLCAAQAPSKFLRRDHAALERRVDAYARIFADAGVLPRALADDVVRTRLVFASRPAPHTGPFVIGKKAVYAIRRDLSALLGVPNFYDLNRLDVDVQTTLDDSLQARALRVFHEMKDSAFVAQHGLQGEHLLPAGDPAGVSYSLLLYEATPGGNHACAHVDDSPGAFDMNSGMKLELGSTAKLRTLAHYLTLVHDLHDELAPLPPGELARRARTARDPITVWAARTLLAEPGIPADTLLERALDRRYSASPYETFFTGSGVHSFSNFDPDDNGRILPLRVALEHSTNLVFIRLMRDLERYHEARLPYDVTAVMADPANPDRRRMLAAAADEESRLILWRAFKRDRALSPDSAFTRALGARPTPKRLAALYYAWHADTAYAAFAAWMRARVPELADDDLRGLARVYGNPDFTLLDYAYVTGMHPLELWNVGERMRDPGASWDSTWARSAPARSLCERWLFDGRHARQQNLRLRPQIEREAFARMTPAWRDLGFPFEKLVPSYATAIGASGDRPAALAELMGIVVNDGLRRAPVDIERVVFGAGTPYHTAMSADPPAGRRVMPEDVARTLRRALAGVVERGTAQRVAGAILGPDSTALPIGGKTGSGDNRFDTFARGGRLVSSRAVSRTATFVFYVGRRHYGVVTATVLGPEAGSYKFTSALPLAAVKFMATALAEHLRDAGDVPPAAPRDATVARVERALARATLADRALAAAAARE